MKLLLLIGFIIIIILIVVLIHTPWVKGAANSDGTILNVNCPLGLGYNSDCLKNTNKRILVPAILKKDASVFCSDFQKIPRIIYQTNLQSQIPLGMNEAIQTILNKNPEYKYQYFSNKECREFLKKHFDKKVVQCYDKLIPGAYKADLFRYCLLYIKGGVYLDTGFVSIQPLKNVITPMDEFLSAQDNSLDAIYNAFICSVPKHPILKRTINICLDRIQMEDYGDSSSYGELYPTGPIALADGFKKYIPGSVIHPNDYGRGIRLIKYQSKWNCLSGIILDNGQEIFYTKYPNYRLEMSWYNPIPSYPNLYKNKMVYSKYQPDIPEGYRFEGTCPMGLPINYEKLEVHKDKQTCVQVIKYRPAEPYPCDYQKIPRVIYQTHERDQIPEGMNEAIQTILDKNPEYEYQYFNNKECREFLKKYFNNTVVQCYDKLIPGAYKADLFRYCLLYIKGGVYLDIGFLALTSLKKVIYSTDEFISAKDHNSNNLYNAFICSVPGHPILKRTINICLDRIQREMYVDALYPTGPIAFGDAFKETIHYMGNLQTGYYEPGIKIIQHEIISTNVQCLSGQIKYNDKIIFYTKYPTYRLDMTWYSKVPNYAKLFDQRKIYN